jgi:hypothetical protein
MAKKHDDDTKTEAAVPDDDLTEAPSWAPEPEKDYGDREPTEYTMQSLAAFLSSAGRDYLLPEDHELVRQVVRGFCRQFRDVAGPSA